MEDAFNIDYFERLLQLARLLTEGWATKVYMAFSSYNDYTNKDNVKVEICNEYTSKETEDINKQVIKNLLSFLKEKQEVDDKTETVSANDFTNRERFNFMLQLASDSDDGSMKFVEIKDYAFF